MTSVSAGHIILTPTQPVGSGRPQREWNPGPPHQDSRAVPTELPRPREREREKEREGKRAEMDRQEREGGVRQTGWLFGWLVGFLTSDRQAGEREGGKRAR